ncbi:MAG: FtsH protease activity modulator HflK [Rhodobacterales bacterium]|nr:FtsH protease activity modulator HflK [Rhodobacterales bacterium]
MAWNPQGGGPWGGGGNQGPWGRGPQSPQPPDIDEIIRKGQDKIKRVLPGGAGSGKGIALIVLIALGVWGITGFYRVDPGSEGVELMFGAYAKQTPPGLHWWFPAPIGEVVTPNVERTNTLTIGFRGTGDGGARAGTRDVPAESLMLTSDQNIIDIDFVVQWRIKSAADYLFHIRDPETTIKAAAESAMREVIGQTPLEEALTVKRQQVQDRALQLLQQILDDYGAGVSIAGVQLQKVDPPAQVIDAFNDVQRAKQDQERSINEANAYRNNIVPRASGEAEKMIQDATAYKERVVKEAEGEAKRFLSVYDTYKAAKDVTTKRLYLERMQEVLGKADKVIIDDKTGGGAGVVPYLPLPELKKRSGG